MPETYFTGIDVGSLSTDLVIIDSNKAVLSEVVMNTGVNGAETARIAFEKALQEAALDREQIIGIVATGYGRATVEFATDRTTEITCHGMGAHHLFPGTGTVIDIGGQDSKVILVDDRGHMLDFAMNDKCAAGTGRFLEVMAQRLDLDIRELSDPENVLGESVKISSTCTVFAESEVVSLLASQTPRDQIVNGLQRSIVNRIWSMVNTVGLQGEVTLTGGVANNGGLSVLLSEKLGKSLNIPQNPQTVGALGAALIARRHALRAR